MRSKLPVAVVERLVNLVSDHLREHLVANHDLPPEIVNDVILHTREKATLDLVGPDAEESDVREFVSLLHRKEPLTPTIILRSLCMGDIGFFEAAVAILARVPITNARRLIHDKGEIGLKAVLDQSKLPKERYPAFMAAVEVWHDTDFDGDENDRERFKRRMMERILTNFSDPNSEFGEANVEYLLGKLSQIDPEIMRMAS